MKKLNKYDLVETIAEKAHLSKKDSREIIDMFIEEIRQSLLKGQEVNLTNFGVFTPKTRKGRDGTHPKEHTRLKIEESRSVTFRPSKELKEQLNK